MKIFIQNTDYFGDKKYKEVADVDYSKTYKFISCKEDEIILEEAESKIVSRNVDFGKLIY